MKKKSKNEKSLSRINRMGVKRKRTMKTRIAVGKLVLRQRSNYRKKPKSKRGSRGPRPWHTCWKKKQEEEEKKAKKEEELDRKKEEEEKKQEEYVKIIEEERKKKEEDEFNKWKDMFKVEEAGQEKKSAEEEEKFYRELNQKFMN